MSHDEDDEVNPIKRWLVANHVAHVNHWWSFTVRGWHVFWRGRLVITRDYQHTEN